MRMNLLQSRWLWGTAWAVMGIVVLSAGAKEPAKDQAVKEQPAAKTAVATKVKAEAAPSGRELFTREWLPNDSRAHGGDGLGPVYNDSSCVACHNQGGIGGGGAASKNVDIVSAFSVPMQLQNFEPQSLPEALFQSIFGGLAPLPPSQPVAPGTTRPLTADETKTQKQQEKAALVKVHPGFASARSVVLHHFGTDPKYQAWRMQMVTGQFFGQQEAFNGPIGTVLSGVAGLSSETPLALSEEVQTVPGPAEPPPVQAAVLDLAVQTQPGGSGVFPITANAVISPSQTVPEVAQLQNEVQMARGNMLNATSQIGNIQISRSQRNATALFGIGQIDAIPEKALEELAKLEQKDYPDVAGRPSKQKDGKIGRFGWKAQKPSLEDFALTACAVELGLNVPGHEQAGLALQPDYKAPGLDMDKAECDALVKFLKGLPVPAQRKPATAQESAMLVAGQKQFAAVGCANCHVQKVAAVDGIYSDLLLHDMGPELGDTGSYGVFVPDMPEEEQDQPIPLANDNPLNAQPQAKMTPEQLAKVIGALRQEWRTPPLWGVRDSGPYLHDGRADTLEQAVAFHGGQAAQSTIKFFQLKPEERQQVIAFLKSLTAPDQALVAAK